MLDSMANEVIVYNVEVNQAVPMKADIPFNRAMEIPVNTVIPIDQELTLPFQTPAGEVTLSVPVQTEVPINTVVPIQFNETISVDTVVQLDTSLPIELQIAKTSLAGYLTQAKSDIGRLKSHLMLKRGAMATEETVVAPASEDGARATESKPVPAEPVDVAVSVSDLNELSDVSEITQQHLAIESSLSSDEASYTQRLGLCAHPYWPLWAGTEWTYNSPDSSYTQRVDNVVNDQVFLSTRYEDRDIQSSMVCSAEGLGGSYLGDMRRITELGDLVFSNPRGTFLPRPETMEQIGSSWRQELDVTGIVPATWDDRVVEGWVTQGRAVAVYTPIRFETLETPLGPREALRIDQKLDLELEISFDQGGQVIPASEVVSLNNVYWFVKDMGLVKAHWQGGTLQQKVEFGDIPVEQQSLVPALAEDQLVSVCVTLADGSVQCASMAGVSEFDLTAPPESELDVPGIIFTSLGASAGSDSPGGAATNELPTDFASDDGGMSLAEYTEALESLSEQIAESAEAFMAAAFEFRNEQLGFDEFHTEFLKFVPEVRHVIQQTSQLDPPSEAEALHQRLIGGMTKCDDAIGIMEQWFDSPNSSTKEAAILLVADCTEDVTQVQEGLTELSR
jgi:hypothetical protein